VVSNFTLRNLCALCASAVYMLCGFFLPQRAEDAEITQRATRPPAVAGGTDCLQALKVELLDFEPVVKKGGGVGQVTRPLARQSDAEEVYIRPRRDFFENGFVMT
jgi:hypothetical protein